MNRRFLTSLSACAALLCSSGLQAADLSVPSLREKKPATTMTKAICELIAIDSIRKNPEAVAKFQDGELETREAAMKTMVKLARETFLSQYSQRDLDQLASKFNQMLDSISRDAGSGKLESFADAHTACHTRAAKLAAPYDGISVTATAEDGTVFKGTTTRYGKDTDVEGQPAPKASNMNAGAGSAPTFSVTASGKGESSPEPTALQPDAPEKRSTQAKPDFQVPAEAKKADTASKDSDKEYHDAYNAMLDEYGKKLDDHLARIKALDEAVPPEKRTKEDWERLEKESQAAMATIDTYSKKMLEWNSQSGKNLIK